MKKLLCRAFGFDNSKHSVLTETIAGVTTFLTMAYILAVNPMIFGALKDMEAGASFTATALAAIVATLVMAFYARKPFVLAPGMGLNAFFVYTVCLGMGYSWKFALTAVFIEGVIFVILTLTKVRQSILNAIPMSLKNAIGGGIGLFIAFIGLQNAGIVVANDATIISLGDITCGKALLGIIGLIVTGVFVARNVKGGILLGIAVTSVIGLFITDAATGKALTQFSGFVSSPPSISGVFCQFEWNHILTVDMLVVVATLLFMDMFDTMGSVIAVAHKAGYINKKGDVESIDKIFMADAIGTVAGACLGTSTTTTYVESSTGVGAGGRTGLTAFTAAVCFALALFLAPLFLSIPGAATAPALIIVGMMMMQPIVNIDWTDHTEALPAFITIVMMPLAYSISDGLLLGVIAYVVINAVAGRFSKLTPTMWILAVLSVMKYLFL
ncbi:MAG: NCS2 family permease [Bacteroidales bacterium]|nr:NCS2 family permease [Candidatus Sodaliphilus aphodohippi]